MPPTLAAIVDTPGLDLTVVTGQDQLDREVRWVHTSELADPTPYLEGGEVLLTTGMRLGRTADERRAYVERLADRGVVGLGLGVGLTFMRVPEVVLEAAEARRLPVFEVPRPTPFIAISKLVSTALAAEQYEAITTSFAAQQELTRAVLGREGTGALVRRLAARLGGWAALYDAAGRPVHVAPAAMRTRAAALADELGRLRALPAPASASLVGAGGTEKVVLQSLGADRRLRGFLAVGTDRPPHSTDRQVIGSAVSLLTLALEQSRALAAAEGRLHDALLRMLFDGGRGDVPGLVRAVVADLGAALPEDPVRVVVATGSGDTAVRYAERLGHAVTRGGGHSLAGEVGDAQVLIVPGAGETFRSAAHDLPGLVAGVSGPVAFADVGEAYRQAAQAWAVGGRAGGGVTVHGQGAASLMPLLDADPVHAWAGELLAPLREHDAGGRGDLTASLRAWLARHGQWDAAAGDLGVHRHTLRYRMRRVEEILGRRLDDPDVRAELWLALRMADTQ